MSNLADAVLRGPRGRRLCLEYVARADEAVSTAVFWFEREYDSHPGALLRLYVGDPPDRWDDPAYTADDVVGLIDDVDLTVIGEDLVRDSFQRSVDLARYWQEPDGRDAVAALPAVRGVLQRVAERLVPMIPRLTAAHGTVQWAVQWHSLSAAGPLVRNSAAILAEWTRAQGEAEARAVRQRPSDLRVNVSGAWWSVPYTLLTTRGTVRDALELVEDSLGWQIATIIPVGGVGKTLEIGSPEDWAALCREYPMDVTASRRHDWFRVTGRDGKWLIPDWEAVSQRWDAVHLTTLGYLSAATRLIQVDRDYGSVIAGWAPDSTLWLTDAATETDEGREQWTRPTNDWRWTRSALPERSGGG